MPSLKRRKRRKQYYTAYNNVQLIRGGKPFFDCLHEMIAAAKETIHLQTYIFGSDDTGAQVAEALKAAVQRGVKVYMLVDGYASQSLPASFISSLKEAGINFRFFAPLFKSGDFYFGRRLHHKVVVTDAQYALVGGINITDRYNDTPGEPAWLDFAVHVHGEAALELCRICNKTWDKSPAAVKPRPCPQIDFQGIISKESACEVGIRRNDWVRRKNQVSSTYVEMCRSAKSRIVILSSYFMPGRVIRRQLKLAVKRGVQVKVITAGVSDVPLAKYAERFLYDWLLRNKIELFEYQPRVLHGKVAVCDEDWVTIGSYNINDISAYASIELNLNIRNAAFAKQTAGVLLGIAEKDCIAVTEELHLKYRSVFRRFAWWVSFQFIRIVFYLFTFYFRHKSRNN
ncbi:phospholipase D-like domain-containing protein [Foetidibacter luteolus]|uniref:phospholipase D-like domain-containing protein n=1 Tax=Foetidibacter luteolus TaxID=2608880 RepID=UPI00129B5906|nr:phospholipase D-like domain-containing protein [Foetidibacter luteolus]